MILYILVMIVMLNKLMIIHDDMSSFLSFYIAKLHRDYFNIK